MPVSRNPARPVSGSPSYSPDSLPEYRGGSSAFFIDEIFTADRVGNFYAPDNFYQDAAGATPAVLAGDVIQESRGGRTVESTTFSNAQSILKQTSAGFRPVVSIDATHGPVVEFIGGGVAKYFNSDTVAALATAIGANGGLFAARIYVEGESSGITQGHAIMSYLPTSDGLFIVNEASDRLAFGDGGTSVAATPIGPYLGQWISVVGVVDAGATSEARLYINDPDVQVDSANIGLDGMSRIWSGTTSASYTALSRHYKMMFIDDPNAATVAQIMSWLEA